MAQPMKHLRIFVGIMFVLAMAEATTPPGIAKDSGKTTCNNPKYKECMNLVHVCPKFCPNSCTTDCRSCKPICIGDTTAPSDPGSDTDSPVPQPPSEKQDDKGKSNDNDKNKDDKDKGDKDDKNKDDKDKGDKDDKDKNKSPPTTPTPTTPSPSYTPPITPSSPDYGPKSPPPSTPTPTLTPPPSTPTPTLTPPPTTPTPTLTPPPTTPTPTLTPPPTTPTPTLTPPPTTPAPTLTPPPTTPTPTLTPPPTTPTPTLTPPTTTPSPTLTPPTTTPTPTQPSPSTPTTPSPPSYTPTPPTPSPTTPVTPTPSFPPSTSGKKRVRCKNKNYGQCYNVEHVCPDACPTGCQVDCASCKPVCNCDMPGAVCQDPRFIGGDGITFYFHGKKDQDFCLVSDSNIHINGHFIGKRNTNLTRDFTWVQSVGILFGNNKLYIGAKKTATWNDAIDHLTLAFKGEPISLPNKQGATWRSGIAPNVSIVRASDTNTVVVEVEGNFKITAKVVPITKEDSRVHNYGITEDNCFAHLDLGFKFYSLSDKVNGVLGQTYGADYVSQVKMGVAMPVMGGEKKFSSSTLFSTDCSVAQFKGGASPLSSEMASLSCGSGLDGGVVCKR